MDIMNIRCDKCDGFGYISRFIVPDEDDNGRIACRSTETCDKCDGKGYTEHAVFSIEEAKAILEHCGLDVEIKEQI